jgi:hypothetical protein
LLWLPAAPPDVLSGLGPVGCPTGLKPTRDRGLELPHDRFDLAFHLLVDGEILLGPQLGMATLKGLTDHDQGHQQDLDQVGNEQPERRSPRNDQKEAHRADPCRDGDREPVKR